jgi:hypothetical protein
MRWFVLFFVLVWVGCGGAQAPSCQDAASHMAKTLGNNPDGSTMTIALCQKESWPPETRRCLVDASSEAAAQRCLDAMPKPAEGPAAPPK